MKKQLLLILLISIMLFTCGQKEEKFTFEPGTQAYELADTLATKIERLDPQKNDVLVKTDDITITVGETLEGIFQNFGPNANQLAGMQPDVVKNIIMSNANALAEKKLLENKAKEMGYTVDPVEIDSVMQLQYDAAGGEEAFKQRIAENNIELSVVRESIESGMLISALLEDEIKEEDFVITETEIRAKFNPESSRRAQHILIDTRQDTTDEQKAAAKKEIEAVLAKAKIGEDFGELAKEYSDCPSSEKGGDLGKITRGQMVPAFDEAVFDMEVDEISDVVETQFGYHIIKLNKIDTNKYEDQREQLKKQVIDDKKKAAYEKYLNEIKEKVNYEELTL